MRYLPHTAADRQAMLAAIGVADIDELFVDVPGSALLREVMDLPGHAGEMSVEQSLTAMAGRNLASGAAASFLGAGAYRHHIPAAVDHLIQRSEFLTAYTPYQPEVSQGTLHYLFEFQTQVALLTGMDVANASMYDGASACAEAVLMAHRVTKRNKAVLCGGLHPHYRDAVETVTQFIDFAVDARPANPERAEDLVALIDEDTACVVVQTPDLFGRLHDLRSLSEAAHARGALVVAVVTEVLSLGAVTSPGEMGADIVVGEGQSLGNALNFGGPYLGLFATRQKYVRQMPGRLCGETVDEAGRRGYVLTLSTREQHIRREKATSNICTNSGLCCLAFCIHLSLLGEVGLRQLAQINHGRAVDLAAALADLDGVEVLNDSFFNEFTLRLSRDAAAVVEELVGRGILAGVPVSRLYPGDPTMADLLLVATTETNTDDDVAALINALREVL
ncbi:MAG: aminomethyl-transferring glycine dehydrogenase subunit GcvPA [Rhodospirillaceae bacterium]|jgi:glycine dehydrogenase subunit 1|nr:aminomethyl-transferring glycine dehydrogenase subunit GcvPA [Rhodospirillaceae bacterium]MBT5194892.1 aminomethyl-transferring glycine dehydrogenase subunit GcvPA [Rhodospirillaceae bacterium]MBT5898973.1 aminomethyl-transferring glycine dehydrogenase subunit GcvPA [Rhodospirillaceae bacterium]MBT6426609.1 aminomethyl-transferring glycine dehydrogenase subunit GcvPA [Rhodospirillaceae bacterium]